MNDNLDLVEILKDCPEGTKLYMSVIDRDVLLKWVRASREYPIRVVEARSKVGFDITRGGRQYKDFPDGEIVLFPSKDQWDWSKFKVPTEKFDYNTLQPFDMVLVRDGEGEGEGDYWRCGLFSCMLSNGMLCECRWNQGIPYNEETKHLLGTTDMPDEKYIWWEE